MSKPVGIIICIECSNSIHHSVAEFFLLSFSSVVTTKEGRQQLVKIVKTRNEGNEAINEKFLKVRFASVYN